MSDPIVERMIELHKELEAVAKGGPNVDGWHPLRLDSKGWVVAGKHVDGEYQMEQFYPTGEWKKASEYLEIQGELRRLLFSNLTPEQINAYRAAVGLPPAESQ